MLIEILKSKIHCARVTEANLNYMGSITIDEDLMDAAILSAALAQHHLSGFGRAQLEFHHLHELCS